jgi:cytochrome c
MFRNIVFGFCTILVLSSAGLIASLHFQENNAPTVKILEPTHLSKLDLKTLVHYRIKVSDREDGDSDYGEIASNEVYLEVRYLPDASSLSSEDISAPDPKGLVTMKKSNCFTCHAFNGKLIAPSFHEIANRYPKTSTNIELLIKHIREGSNGVWGTVSMPTHTELTEVETRDIVNWILENGKNENLNYYVGIEGNMRIKTPDRMNQKGAFMISATYSDHGTKNNPQKYLSAKDVILMFVK